MNALEIAGRDHPGTDDESIRAALGSVSDLDVILAMRKYGGSFVRALAEAALRADDSNLARIKTAWPDYWEKYRAMHIDRERLCRKQ